jgi:hypothetical protein
MLVSLPVGGIRPNIFYYGNQIFLIPNYMIMEAALPNGAAQFGELPIDHFGNSRLV